MERMAHSEALFMEAMPLIPLSFRPGTYLTKPYVRGLKVDQLSGVSFRYAWIDHNFKEGDHP